MQVMTTTALRRNLASALDAVVAEEEELVVPRDDGAAVVIVDLKTWNSMKETLHVLGDRKQTMQLMESIGQLEDGKGTEHDLLDVEPDAATEETFMKGEMVPAQRRTVA